MGSWTAGIKEWRTPRSTPATTAVRKGVPEARQHADAQQQEQLAAASAERSERKAMKEAVFEKEDALRNRLPAVIEDVRESTPTTEDEAIRRVTRVRREDIPTRATALAALCRALLKPGREPIITAFEARGMPAGEIESLAQQAEALAEAGRNVKVAVEATDREAEAVAKQKRKWGLIRRMVRSAVASVPDLEKKVRRVLNPLDTRAERRTTHGQTRTTRAETRTTQAETRTTRAQTRTTRAQTRTTRAQTRRPFVQRRTTLSRSVSGVSEKRRQLSASGG